MSETRKFPCDRCNNTGRVLVQLDSPLERAGGAYRDICPSLDAFKAEINKEGA